MTGDQPAGPYYVILDVAIRDEVSTGRMIGVEGLPPGVPAAAAPRPRAVPGPPT